MNARDDPHRLQHRMRVLSGAARSFAEASQSTERLLQAVVRTVADGLACSCSLSLVADDGIHFTSSHVHAADQEKRRGIHACMAEDQRIDADPGVKFVIDTGTPFFRPAADFDSLCGPAEAEAEPSGRDLRARNALVVPLLQHGKVIGALGLTRPGEDAIPLDEADLALAEALAQTAAVMLSTARLLEQAASDLLERERMAARLRLLADAAHDFSEATGDYAQLLAVIARRVGEGLGDLCAIRGVSEDGLWLETGEVHHHDPETVAWIRRLSFSLPQRVGEGVTGRVAASRQPLFMPRLAEHEFTATAPPEYREFLDRLDVRSVVAVPMVCRDQVVGVAMLLRSGSARPYTEDDLNLVRSVVHHAAIAIANARSYAAERTARAAAVEANAALNRSEEAHRLLFDASPMPLLVFDVRTLAPLAVNDAALRLYGYGREEFMLAKVSVLSGEGEESAKARVSQMPTAELRGIARHVRKDGTHVVAEYATRPLFFAGHEARISALNDVTGRFEAEQTRSLLAAIVESSSDAIVSKRLDGTITSWNRAAERLFGYTAAEIIGRPITVLIPGDRLHEQVELVREVAAGRSVNLHQTVRLRKDGTEVAVSVSLAPVRDGAGNVVGASKTARDLSAQRAAEEALRRSEDQLRQAQKMEAIGRLGGGIAHDFNNLLSVILSYSDLIASDLSPADPIRADIAEIHKAASSAAGLTRQLLVFSRQQVIAPKVLDLNEILAAMDKMLRRILGEDVDLVSILAPSLGRVLVDPSNIEQVVMNLVVNARDAMPTGGKLTMETGNVDLDAEYAGQHMGSKAGPHVMLAVTDTGTGMDRATQTRIFEPFFTTKEVGKGTGLGLATVFGIAQQSGGSVWVYSELAKGSTFKVYFPRVESALDLTERAPTLGTLRGTETILLVEDQDQVRNVAKGILKRHGYHVIVAQNAGEALLICETVPGAIHLLLTDVVMPHMSGAELAKRITLSRPDTKVLCMSGYTDDSVVRHGVLESSVAFLQKPFTPESLARRVRDVLNTTY
jgi:two-component system, cell cycle sensor histidine kinase and response regulator CckA